MVRVLPPSGCDHELLTGASNHSRNIQERVLELQERLADALAGVITNWMAISRP